MVDDEPDVRILIGEMLRDLGLHVVEATDAAMAFDHLQRCPKLALLITDVGMPGLNGRQLAERAREWHPGLPVMLITGYAGNAFDNVPLPHGIELMFKPFSFDAMAARVLATLRLPRPAGMIKQDPQNV